MTDEEKEAVLEKLLIPIKNLYSESSEDMELFRYVMSKASLLKNCRAKNFRAYESRAILVLAMPSAAENHLRVKCMK